MTRGRIWALAAIVVVLILLFLSKGLAVFYTDYLWFASPTVHLTQVWRGIVGVKVGLAVVFVVFFFLICWVNLIIVDRSLPDLALAAAGPEDELVQRFRTTVGRRSRLVHVVVSLALALAVGVGAAGQWNKWILFRNSSNFTTTDKALKCSAHSSVMCDPQFHKPVAFFVFQLPFIEFVISWVFMALVVVTIATLVFHYFNGGIRIQARTRRVGARVKAHISVLLALLALVKAIGYYYQRFELDTSTRGFVEGASYTDVHAQLPAINLLMWISLVAFVLFIVNIQRQGWALPATALGLWLLLALVVGFLYPTLIQNFKVNPAQNVLEKPYIQRNIESTRYAMGIENVKVRSFPYQSTLSTSEISQYSQSLSDAQLWDPEFAIQTFDKLQDIRSYYRFNLLSVDRYPIGIGGQMTPVVLGVRSINNSQLPATSWVNEHLQYTHGYGVALAPANEVSATATPNFAIGDLPPVSTVGVPLTQPSAYFGVNMPGWVIVHTRQSEIDYQLPNGNTQSTTYGGKGGVQLTSILRRLAFAIRFGDVKTLISSQITRDSRVIFVRDIQAAVQKAAPFLSYDANPYPVILNGQINWIQDAYTTTNGFPYGQPADTNAVKGQSGLQNIPFNYIRNSVKVLVNAYTGKMTFYVMDPNDPVIRAYSKAFPGMFLPASSMSPELRSHLRYPEDLMTVQAAAYGSYHITNVAGFYNQGDAWELSQDPGSGDPASVLAPQTKTNSQGQTFVTGTVQRMPPVYQVLQMPGSSVPSFTLMEPMVPYSANDQVQNLNAYMVGMSDPRDYGHLYAYVLPRGQTIDGPALVDATMAATPSISQAISLLNQQGSSVQLGDVLPIPVGNTIVYVRPLYVESSRNPLPQLQKIIVVTGKNAAMDSSLEAALQDLLQTSIPNIAPSGTSGSGVSGPALSTAVLQSLQQAQTDYQNAQQALAAGDLGKYQADINQMYQNILQAQQAAGGPPPPSSTSSSTPATTTTTTSAAGSPTTPAPTTTSAPAAASRRGSALSGTKPSRRGAALRSG